MLKKIRIGFALVCFMLLTLLFLDFTGTLHHWLGWLAKIQFLPALLALNISAVIILAIITLLLGRVYCSVICPLGIFQDVVSWIAGKRKKNRFSYSKVISWLRYGFLALFIVAFIAGISSFVALLDPYGSYGRIASNLFAPVYRWGNNVFAYFAQRVDSYAFYHVDVWIKSLTTFVIAILTFVVIAVLSWRNGRIYCNTVCPVGTILGFFSKFSFFKPVFDTEKCNGCTLCARNCKASCIDTKNHTIDYSRCVTCFDCVDKCPRGAIRYISFYKANKPSGIKSQTPGASPGEGNNSRRSFLSMAAMLTVSGTLKAQEKVVEGGLAVIEKKKIPNRTIPVTPPGSISAKNFTEHCTACGLCISACPNQVLRPSGKLLTLMQPEMSYERGYCRPECTECSEVCPTGAIKLITKAEKSATQIGYAVWVRDNCIVITDGVDCGNCARHCPSGAIEMVASDPNNPKSGKIPAVNTERCIGCGTCENLCPAHPFSAIYVEGIEIHRTV